MKRIFQHIMAPVLTLICLGVCGCSPRSSRNLQWNPCYWEGCLANTIGAYPRVTTVGLSALACRSGLPDYWLLVDTVREDLSDADELIIIEQVAGQSTSGYWWAVVARKGKKVLSCTNNNYWMTYLGESKPKTDARPTIKTREDESLASSIQSVVAQVVDNQGALLPVDDEPGVDLNPIMVHAYRAKDGSVRNIMAKWVQITPDSIRGDLLPELLPENRAAPMENEMSADEWSQLDDDVKARWRANDKQTYAARLLVNGAFRVLYRQR